MALRLLIYILPALAALGALYVIDGWRRDARELPIVKKAFEDYKLQAASDRKLSNEVSREHAENVALIRARVADYERLHPNTCVAITADTPGADRPGTPGKSDRPNGVPARALIAFAADAEELRQRAASCKRFLEKTWVSRNQEP